MDNKEAIARIKEHKEIHFAKEYPFAIKITEALEMAIEALEKQTPRMPQEYGKYEFLCPCCAEKLGVEVEDICIYQMTPPKYCDNCGQALDWSEV